MGIERQHLKERAMAQELPQIYLVTPPEFELARFPEVLATVLDSHEIACVRLSMASRDEDRIARAADALREITHARDVALVIDSHILLVERLGLDGVHLTDGARLVRKTRKDLGADAIIGAHCGSSRHEGMNAGEAGADYVSFGPVGASVLGNGEIAEAELFDWWSQMIELPVVAEGGLTPALVRALAPMTDFFAIGDEIWSASDPASELAALKAAMAG
jgi:thiamine-phosphate pyrophosphorylase